MFIKRLARLTYAITVAALSMLTSIALPGAAADHRSAAEMLKPRQQLEFFEVYHVPDDALYRVSISVDALTSSMRARDYVRVQSDNKFAVDSLYHALEGSIVSTDAPCNVSSIDVRWAIVLNYSDHTQQKIGFNRIVNCLQLSMGNAPISATPELLKFVDRTFGFMR